MTKRRSPPSKSASPDAAPPGGATDAAAAARAESRAETRGILFFALAILLFSVMDVVAKDLSARMHPMQVVWARYASQTAWAAVLLAPWLGRLLRTPFLKLQILRSALMFVATLAFFTAISLMPLAEAVAVFEIAPLLMTALAFFILRERVGPRRWAGVAVGFLGAMIIVRPGSEVFSFASLLPMVAALAFAGFSIVTRFLGDKENPWSSFLYSTLFGTLAASLALPFFWTAPAREDMLLMAGFGLLGGGGQMCLVLAFRHAAASAIAPFSYLGLVFAALWGWLVFSELPDRWTVAGALVIVSAGLYVWWREQSRRAA